MASETTPDYTTLSLTLAQQALAGGRASSGGGVASSVSVSNFPATQAISAASLPLPTGAAQDGTDISSPTAMPAGGSGIRGWLSAIWTKLNGTLAISAASLPLPTGAAQDSTLTGGSQKTKLVDSGGTNVATVSAAGAVKVDGSAVTQPARLPISGVTQMVCTETHITTKTTTTVTASTCYVQTILVNCSNAGTAFTWAIQDKNGPHNLIPSTTATAGLTQFNFTAPVLMGGGIDIVTAGTTAGVLDVYVTYWQ